MPGEAFQFDWSEDWAIIGGERTKLQAAHFKLSYSRAFTLRAYRQQTHEMLFDAHNDASCGRLVGPLAPARAERIVLTPLERSVLKSRFTTPR
jgi:hypothetical protein